ncbi:MAG: hypothetical protein ACI9MU_003395, partial [Alphaproteobacteria bacterium]
MNFRINRLTGDCGGLVSWPKNGPYRPKNSVISSANGEPEHHIFGTDISGQVTKDRRFQLIGIAIRHRNGFFGHQRPVSRLIIERMKHDLAGPNRRLTPR